MLIARARYSGWWMPMFARHSFIAHCRRAGASFICASMRSRSSARSSPSGAFATRSLVSAHPALATTGSGSANQRRAKFLDVRVLLDDVVHEPVVHLGDTGIAEHGVQLGRGEGPGAADQDRDETGRRVAGLPELTGEVGLDTEGLRDRAEPGEVDPVVVAVAFVHRADPRILQGREVGHHPADRGRGCRKRRHTISFVSVLVLDPQLRSRTSG